MFTSLWRYIRRIFSLMPELERILPLKPHLRDRPNVFFEHICDAPKDLRALYTVTEIVWYKQLTSGNKAEHEFLVAKVHRPADNHTVYLLVERGPTWEAKRKQVMKTVDSSRFVPAWDDILCIDHSAHTALLTERVVNRLGSSPFPSFPVLEFLRMVHIVTNYKPDYQLNGAMCYWYAEMIAHLAMTHFGGPDSNSGRPTGAGKLRGVNVFRESRWKEDFAAINGKYIEAKTIDPDPISLRRVQEAKQKEETARERALKEEERALKEEERALKEEERALKEQSMEREAARAEEAARERALKEAAQDKVRSLEAQLRRAGATGTQLDFGSWRLH
jgi:hypothetical protein